MRTGVYDERFQLVALSRDLLTRHLCSERMLGRDSSNGTTNQLKEITMAGPITNRKVRVGVLGAGRWANGAHLPGWARDPRCELVAICDVDRGLADETAQTFSI